MKTFVAFACFLAALDAASAGATPPQVTIGIDGGTDDTPIKIQPAIKWVADTKILGTDIEGGLVSVVEDLGSIRYKVWGKIKRSLGGVALSTRADVASDDKERIDLDLSLDSEIVDIHVAATATTNKTIDFKNVQLKKGFGLFGGRLTVNPRYNLKSFTGDVKLSYEMEKTTFDVKASGDDQQLTVSRVVGENTIVAPSISTSGDFSLAVQQQTDIGKITGTLKSNDSLSLQWEDGTWVATAVAPIEGYRYNGVKMSVKKLVEFD